MLTEQLRAEQSGLIAMQKSAEGIVGGTGAAEGPNKLRMEITRKERPDGT